MNLRPGAEPATATLVLRTFRAVLDGPSFCWDLFLRELATGDDEVELPDWLAWQEPARASMAGSPAFSARQGLDDRVYVSLSYTVQAEGGEPERVLVLDEQPGWLRSIALRARDGRLEVVWCLRVEGGPELGTPIARAWTQRVVATCSAAQLTLPTAPPAERPEPALRPSTRARSLAVVPDLPPEIDDEGQPDPPPPPPPRRRPRAS